MGAGCMQTSGVSRLRSRRVTSRSALIAQAHCLRRATPAATDELENVKQIPQYQEEAA